MRGSLLLLLTLLLPLPPAAAQWSKGFKTNDLEVKYGYLSCMMIVKGLKDMEQSQVTASNLEARNRKSAGAISAEFTHRKRKKFSFGLSATWERTQQECYNVTPFTETHVGDLKSQYITVTPLMRFNWVERTFFMMYTKLAAGVTFIADKWSGTEEQYADYGVQSAKQHYFGYQVSPLGFIIGRNICGYAEIGFGCQGLVQAGALIKFGR